MPSSTALRDHLNLFETRDVTLTLAQISSIIGWAPTGARSTADYIGAPGEPTPFVHNISAAMADGWTVTNANQPGRITFTRKGPPRAPSLIDAAPSPLPPSLDAYAAPPLPASPRPSGERARKRGRQARRHIIDPTHSGPASP
jgi:hypothetical protein